MPRQRELPPVPDNPPVSPPVILPGEERVTIVEPTDGFRLEALARIPEGAERAVVLCHPHPLYGGTMHSAVVLAVAKVLGEMGGDQTASIRFNYRGVGASEGRYDEAKGETRDARAIIGWMRRKLPAAKIALCGYSFGTFVGLRAASLEGGFDRIALIAPALRIFDFVREDAERAGASIAVYIGSNDDFCDVEEAEGLARDIGGSCEVFEGQDHFFIGGRRKLAGSVVPFIAPELGA